MKKKVIAIIVLIIIIALVAFVFLTGKKRNGEKREYEITEVKVYNYFESKAKDELKYGVIDRDGNQVIPEIYDDVKIPNPSKPVFVCTQGENTKVLNNKNEEIFNDFKNVDTLRLKNVSGDLVFEKSVLKYEKDGKYGLVNLEGNKITDPIFEEIDTLQYKEAEMIVKKDGKYGIINQKGYYLVENKYDKINADGFFEEDMHYRYDGYVVANKTDEGYRYGYVAYNGKEYQSMKYNALERISEVGNREEIYLLVAENGRYGVLKNDVQLIPNEYQLISYDVTNKIFVVQKGKKYGVINIDGKQVLPCDFEQIDVKGKNLYAKKSEANSANNDSNGDNEGNIEVYSIEGKLTNIDANTILIDVPNYEGYTIFIQNNEQGTNYQILKNNQPITTDEYSYISFLQNNLFIASKKDEKLGIIDINGQARTDFKYTSIQAINDTKIIQLANSSDGNVEVADKDAKIITQMKGAVISKEGDYIILTNGTDRKYISIDGKEVSNKEVYSSNSLFASYVDGKWGFVDNMDNKKIDYQYDNVTEFNEYGFAGIFKDGKWGVIKQDGTMVLKPVYEMGTQLQPSFIGQYYRVDNNSGQVFYAKK